VKPQVQTGIRIKKSSGLSVPEPVVDENSPYASQLLAGVDMAAVMGGIALIVGLGTVGEVIAEMLAVNGWGLIILVDWGRAEIRNVGRSRFYLKNTLGEYKAKILAPALSQFRDNLECVGLVMNARDLPDELFRHATVVFEALDFSMGKLWMAHQARANNKTVISFGIGSGPLFHDDWEVGVWPPDGACRECDWAEKDYKSAETWRRSCDDEVPLEGPKAGMVPFAAAEVAVEGARQGQRIAEGKETTFTKFMRFSGAANQVRLYGPDFNPMCRGHEAHYDVIFIEYDGGTTVEDVYAMAAEELGTSNIAIGLRYRHISTSKTCSNEFECDHKDDFFGLQKSVEEDNPENCPKCGERMVARSWINQIPVSNLPLSFFEVNQFVHLVVTDLENGVHYHLASKRCETKEDFINEVLENGEALYNGGEN